MLTPTIGIEVHVELKSNAKVFSKGKNDFKTDPNTNVNIVDLGYPGTLPTLNKEVINMALKAALALNCQINKTMNFDRKNYFYPDLPKGYQITQKDTPIGYDGYIEINDDGQIKKIGIERIHIEEDTCKSIHTNEGTLLNFNRAGVPLIEIVTKPVIKTPKEAVLYVEKLREILLYLGISDVKIEEGSMRCDANISLSSTSALGTKTEIKNIGSITNVLIALEKEIIRQTKLLENNEVIVEQTRRFDDKINDTVLMRVKETGNDYRYFPEPDLPTIILTDEMIKEVNLPLLPDQIREQFKQININDNAIKTLISNVDMCKFIYGLDITDEEKVLASNIMTGDILAYLNKNTKELHDTKITKERFIDLVKKYYQKTISSKQVKDIIPYLLSEEDSIDSIIKKYSLEEINDTEKLTEIINSIVANNPDSVIDFKEGKDRAVKYLMGQIMKETKGSASPSIANQMLIDILKKY